MILATRTPDESSKKGFVNGEYRYEVLLTAEIDSEQLPFPVSALVKNISSGGLKARIPEDVPIEGRVKVKIRDGGVLLGRVAWRKNSEAGIAFDKQLDPFQLLIQRREVQMERRQSLRLFIDRAKHRLGLESPAHLPA